MTEPQPVRELAGQRVELACDSGYPPRIDSVEAGSEPGYLTLNLSGPNGSEAMQVPEGTVLRRYAGE